MSSTSEITEEAVPYTGPKPYGMSEDWLVPGALDLDSDEKLCVAGDHPATNQPTAGTALAASSVDK